MTIPRTITVSALAGAMLIGACVAIGAGRSANADGSLLYRDHPLADRIWKPDEARYASQDEVAAAVSRARFVLIGEKHDNPRHHRLQAQLLGRMIAEGRRPAVVFEMLTPGQQPAVDSFLAGNPPDAAGLGRAVDWAKTGWPDWEMYQPIADAAVAAGAPLLAGGLERATIRDVARNGVDVFDRERVRTLRLDEPVAADRREAMREEIYQSHCQQLPRESLDPMVTVTLVKDAVMAAQLIDGAASPGRDSAVLIAGDGHVRDDRGVPWHLRKREPEAVTVAVGILEVSDGEEDPATYAERFGGQVVPFDFVWFTGRVDDADPCEVFAEQLRKARERGERGGDDGNK